jgi:hypothetical protein
MLIGRSMALAWMERVARSETAAGPYDAWLLPRREMAWRHSSRSIRAPLAKLGGQPFWLDDPFWPLSSGYGSPMTFVGQVPLPGPDLGLSYLFITQDDDATAEVYEAEGGENALLVQPGGRIPSFLAGTSDRTGPTLWRRGADWEDHIPVELHVDLHAPAADTDLAFEREYGHQQATRREFFLPPTT